VKKLRAIILPIVIPLLSTALLFAAFFFRSIGTCPPGLTAEYYPDAVHWFENSNVILFGWGGFIFFQFGWFANIFFILALVCFVQERPVKSWMIVAHCLLLASSFAFVPLGHNEANTEPTCWRGLGTGFWLWATANALVISASIVSRHSARDDI
jgi:hypothetical protein